MKRSNFVYLLVFLLCGCAGNNRSDKKLSHSECEALFERIDEISVSSLPGEQRTKAMEFLKGKKSTVVKECEQNQSWNRQSYECVMKAKNQQDLQGCIIYSGE